MEKNNENEKAGIKKFAPNKSDVFHLVISADSESLQVCFVVDVYHFEKKKHAPLCE